MLLSQNKFRFLTALQLEDDALALQVRDSPDTSRRHTTATADEGATQSCAPGSLSARRRAHMIAMLDRPSRDRLAPSPEATASPLKQTSPQFKARVRNIAKMARRTGQYGLGLRLLRSVGEDPRKTAQKRRKKRTKRILKTQQVAKMQPKPIEIVAPMSPIVSTLRATHAPVGSASPSDGQAGAFDTGVWNSAALMAMHASFYHPGLETDALLDLLSTGKVVDSSEDGSVVSVASSPRAPAPTSVLGTTTLQGEAPHSTRPDPAPSRQPSLRMAPTPVRVQQVALVVQPPTGSDVAAQGTQKQPRKLATVTAKSSRLMANASVVAAEGGVRPPWTASFGRLRARPGKAPPPWQSSNSLKLGAGSQPSHGSPHSTNNGPVVTTATKPGQVGTTATALPLQPTPEARRVVKQHDKHGTCEHCLAFPVRR